MSLGGTSPKSRGKVEKYSKEAEYIVIDERAHDRINRLEDRVNRHTAILVKIEESMKTTCTTLTSLSDKLKPITFTISATGYIQKFIVWVSPIALICIAFWKVYDELLHNHVP